MVNRAETLTLLRAALPLRNEFFHESFQNLCTAIVAGFVLACAFRCPGAKHTVPVIPDATFNVTDYGAAGDGRTLNTAAIRRQLIRLPPPEEARCWFRREISDQPFTLASSINLHLARDAFILISDELTNYPATKGRYQDSISASGAHDLEISGEGTIDGQGNAWWTAFRTSKSRVPRPKHDQTVELHPGAHPRRRHPEQLADVPSGAQNCMDVTIQGITIRSPAMPPTPTALTLPDGTSSSPDCTIDVGMTNIAIKPTGSRTPGSKHSRSKLHVHARARMFGRLRHRRRIEI